MKNIHRLMNIAAFCFSLGLTTLPSWAAPSPCSKDLCDAYISKGQGGTGCTITTWDKSIRPANCCSSAGDNCSPTCGNHPGWKVDTIACNDYHGNE